MENSFAVAILRLPSITSRWRRERRVDAHLSGNEDVGNRYLEFPAAAWSEVFRYLQEMNPYDFQDLIAHLLRAVGYHVDWVSPPGPDRGLDILAYTDPVGATGPRIKMQVKRRADKISVDGVRSFMAILDAQDVGICVSSGGFTSDAEHEIRGQENRRISLMGPEKFFDLWVEHYEKLTVEGRQLLPLRPVHFLAL
jgi:restriction system protein